MEDLLLDPNIRIWVFLPIVLLTFLVENIRKYLVILLQPEYDSVDPEEILDSHILNRAEVLTRNHGYILEDAFIRRRNAFNNVNNGYLLRQRTVKQQDIMSDPKVMLNVLRNNLTNVYPTILVGGWVSWLFSGFVTTRVPFPLTYCFKFMLQRGIELNHLNPSWVSSISWYLINVFGQKNIFDLLTNDNMTELMSMIHDSKCLQVDFGNDLKPSFREQWEALEIVKHSWSLKKISESVF